MRFIGVMTIALGIASAIVGSLKFRTSRSFRDPAAVSRGIDYAGSYEVTVRPAFLLLAVFGGVLIGLGVVLFQRASA